MKTFNIFDEFTNRPDWDGHGYLGARNIQLEQARNLKGTKEEYKILNLLSNLATSDLVVLSHAVRNGWSDAQLFAWCNSKLGRWWGDEAFGRDMDYDMAILHGLFEIRGLE